MDVTRSSLDPAGFCRRDLRSARRSRSPGGHRGSRARTVEQRFSWDAIAERAMQIICSFCHDAESEAADVGLLGKDPEAVVVSFWTGETRSF